MSRKQLQVLAVVLAGALIVLMAAGIGLVVVSQPEPYTLLLETPLPL